MVFFLLLLFFQPSSSVACQPTDPHFQLRQSIYNDAQLKEYVELSKKQREQRQEVYEYVGYDECDCHKEKIIPITVPKFAHNFFSQNTKRWIIQEIKKEFEKFIDSDALLLEVLSLIHI